MISGFPDGKRSSQEVLAALDRGSLSEQSAGLADVQPRASAARVAAASRGGIGQPAGGRQHASHASRAAAGPGVATSQGQPILSTLPPPMSFTKQEVSALDTSSEAACRRDPVQSSLASALGAGAAVSYHRPGLRGASSYDGTATIQISVALDIDQPDGGLGTDADDRKTGELNLFGRSTVDQAIGMVLRQFGLGLATDEYELFLVNGPDRWTRTPGDLPLNRGTELGRLGSTGFALRLASSARLSAGNVAIRASSSATSPTALPDSPTDSPMQPCASPTSSSTKSSHRRVGSSGCELAGVDPEVVGLTEQELAAAATTCAQCGERIDFERLRPHKIGALEKLTDVTKIWKPRWFHLYGNHLVYYLGGPGDGLSLDRPRGIIHLEPDCKVLLEDPTEANRTSSAPSEWTENSAVNGAGQQACNTPKRTYKPTGSPPTTIQAGSIGSIVDRDELAGGRSRLLPSDVDLFADENSEPIDNDQTSTGEKLCPADDARTSTIAAPEKPSGLTIWLTMPKKTSPYHLRARSEHERNSWATALERAKQHLYRTCIHCWANVDAASSGATVLRAGWLHLNGGRPKVWDRRFMVLTRNPPAAARTGDVDGHGALHVVYYDSDMDLGRKPARGCIHLFAGGPAESTLQVHVTRAIIAPRHSDSPFADLPSPTESQFDGGGPSLVQSLLGKHPAMLSTSPLEAIDAAEAAAAAAATVYRLHVQWSGLRHEEDAEMDKVVSGQHVLFKRWSECTRFHATLAKEIKRRAADGMLPRSAGAALPASVRLPAKKYRTRDPVRLEKRRNQLNHYFAELTGWAQRHAIDLWQSSPAVRNFLSPPTNSSQQELWIDNDIGGVASEADGAGLPKLLDGEEEMSGDEEDNEDGEEEEEDDEQEDREGGTVFTNGDCAQKDEGLSLSSLTMSVADEREEDNDSLRSSRAGGVQRSLSAVARRSFAFGLSVGRRDSSTGGLAVRNEDDYIWQTAAASTADSGEKSDGSFYKGPEFAQNILGAPNPETRHYFHLQSPSLTYYLYASSASELAGWMDALDLEPPPTEGESLVPALSASDTASSQTTRSSRVASSASSDDRDESENML